MLRFKARCLKPLPTGGVAGITFSTVYTNLTAPPAGIVNPAYRPTLQFQFEQPLLQGFGVEINELRRQHPEQHPDTVPDGTVPDGLFRRRHSHPAHTLRRIAG